LLSLNPIASTKSLADGEGIFTFDLLGICPFGFIKYSLHIHLLRLLIRFPNCLVGVKGCLIEVFLFFPFSSSSLINRNVLGRPSQKLIYFPMGTSLRLIGV
jgi:hypothetical protein